LIDRQINIRNRNRALRHIENIRTDNKTVTLVKGTAKDDFGEPTETGTLDIKAFVRLSPFERKTYERITWADNVDILLYASKKAIYDLGYTIDDIKEYQYIKVDKKKYELKYTEFKDNFGDDYLSIIIGGAK